METVYIYLKHIYTKTYTPITVGTALLDLSEQTFVQLPVTVDDLMKGKIFQHYLVCVFIKSSINDKRKLMYMYMYKNGK